jgi:hypothetical protein
LSILEWLNALLIVKKELPQPQLLEAMRIGYRATDGTVYAGLNQKGECLYTTERNIGRHDWRDATDRVRVINKMETLYGYSDWDLPTGKGSNTNELENNFYANQKEIGGFNEGKSSEWVWSGTESEANSDFVKILHFGVGKWNDALKSDGGFVRPVRRTRELVI